MSQKRGERNPAAKLSDAEVQQIRDLRRNTRYSQEWIARRYGVSQAQVSAIMCGRSRTI